MPVPELPEIEAIADGLARVCTGRQITGATAHHPSVIKSAEPGLADVVDQTITAIRRRGKLILIDTDRLSVVVHLMQSGRIGLSIPPHRARGRAVALVLSLDDESELRIREAATEHRLSVWVVERSTMSQFGPLANLGPEPIGLSPAAWRERLTAPPGRLSTALREGRRVAGIGRAYASDIMWAARLAPFARTDRLSDADYERLARAADTVLSQALSRARETITTDMPTREHRVTAVHGHYGDPCLRCGRSLERVAFEQYELVYCPDCQTGGRIYADRRMSRLLR